MTVKNVEKKENNTAAFQVETDAAEFEGAVNGAYLKNKSSIYIPGFRKGKAPRAVVEGMYGHEVFYQDAMDELAPKAFDQGLKESGLRIVGAPAISDVKVTDERTVEYTFEVTLYPEAVEERYKFTPDPDMNGFELLEQAAKKRGFLVSRGEYDIERMANTLLGEYHEGKLGRLSLEAPDD